MLQIGVVQDPLHVLDHPTMRYFGKLFPGVAFNLMYFNGKVFIGCLRQVAVTNYARGLQACSGSELPEIDGSNLMRHMIRWRIVYLLQHSRQWFELRMRANLREPNLQRLK